MSAKVLHRDVARTIAITASHAPEQFGGTPALTPRTDVYSFGVLLYEMLGGRRPFAGTSVRQLAMAHRWLSAPPLPHAVPSDLRALVEQCLAKDPAARFPNFEVIAERVTDAARAAGLGRLVAPRRGLQQAEEALDSGGWNSRGFALVQVGALDGAIRSYRAGIEKARRTGESTRGLQTLYDNLGAALVRQNRLDEGRAALAHALQLDPCDALALLRLGQLEISAGHVDEGLRMVRRSTDCEPDNFDYLLKYLTTSYRLGRRALFEDAFARFLEGKKSDAPFLVYTGIYLDQEIGPEIALRCFDRALRTDPRRAGAWFNKGVTLHLTGDKTGARECYAEAIKLDANHSFARCYLALLQLERGERKEALRNLSRFLENAPPGPLTNLVRTALEGAQMGVAPEAVLAFATPMAIRHVA